MMARGNCIVTRGGWLAMPLHHDLQIPEIELGEMPSEMSNQVLLIHMIVAGCGSLGSHTLSGRIARSPGFHQSYIFPPFGVTPQHSYVL